MHKCCMECTSLPIYDTTSENFLIPPVKVRRRSRAQLHAYTCSCMYSDPHKFTGHRFYDKYEFQFCKCMALLIFNGSLCRLTLWIKGYEPRLHGNQAFLNIPCLCKHFWLTVQSGLILQETPIFKFKSKKPCCCTKLLRKCCTAALLQWRKYLAHKKQPPEVDRCSLHLQRYRR